MQARWLGLAIIMALQISVSAFAESAAVLAEKKTERFLNQFPVIRMAITMSPGNGHQSAAATLIKRLRAIGYRGQFEVLYQSSVASKLEFLLPPFNARGPDEQFIAAYNAKFIKADDLINKNGAKIGHTTLTILAADDWQLTPTQLNSDYLVTINPFNWKPQIKVGASVRTLPRSVKSVHTGSPHVDDLEEFLDSQLSSSPALARKKAGLKQLAEAVLSKKYDLLTAYGLGVEGVGKLATILRALEALKINRANEFPRPIIVGLISNLNQDEWNSLRAHLASKTSLPHLKILEIDDLNGLAEVGEGEIAILKISNVSQDVWNYLMTLSTFPPTVAGANGIDFMNQLEKPFMSVAEVSPASKLSSNYDEMGSLGQRVYMALQKGDATFIARFIRDSQIPGTFVSKTFAEHSRSLSAQPDRICDILLKAESDISAPWLTRNLKWRILEALEALKDVFY